MNRCLDHEVENLPPPRPTKTKGTNTFGLAHLSLACLLLVWIIFSVATALLLVVLFGPDHSGLSHLVQALGNLVPVDSPIYTT
jgi:hypothetical protein